MIIRIPRTTNTFGLVLVDDEPWYNIDAFRHAYSCHVSQQTVRNYAKSGLVDTIVVLGETFYNRNSKTPPTASEFPKQDYSRAIKMPDEQCFLMTASDTNVELENPDLTEDLFHYMTDGYPKPVSSLVLPSFWRTKSSMFSDVRRGKYIGIPFFGKTNRIYGKVKTND